MRFPPHLLDDIRARLPISAVIGRRVAWDKRRSNPGRGDWWACCPFHGEKTPSFHAEDRKGRYHCFGCGVSGDHFTFLVEQEGMSFPDAVAQLAAEAGVTLPERRPGDERREAERASLHEVIEKAARYFEAALKGPDGAKARAYLRERGLAPDVERRFRLGYAPPGRNGLKQHLADAGISQDLMVEAGLLVAGEDIPVSYDRFRDRVMFPITDARGKVIAFGGRALAPDAQPKYLNSPETPLFRKGHVLYNAQAARAALRRGGHLLVVEGYIDAIACAAAGFESTVAPLGTALTEDQLHLLWGMADEPILCFDGDAAGLKAASRAIDLALPLLKPGKSLKFALLPQGQDPDDLIRSQGPDAFAAVLEAARPLSQMMVSRELSGVDLSTPESRAALERRLYAMAFAIGDKDLARHFRDYFRLRLSELFWTSDGKRRNRPPAGAAPSRPPENTLEKIIVGICVREPTLFRDHHDDVVSIDFTSHKYRAFFLGLERLLMELEDASVYDVYRELGDAFYEVLREAHGEGLRRPDGLEPTSEALDRLFPALKLQPTVAALGQTLRYFLLRRRLRQYEAELDAKIGLFEDERWADQVRGLQEFRASVLQSERELDIVYQRLRFRPANDNSLGAAVLDGERNWRAALRR